MADQVNLAYALERAFHLLHRLGTGQTVESLRDPTELRHRRIQSDRPIAIFRPLRKSSRRLRTPFGRETPLSDAHSKPKPSH